MYDTIIFDLDGTLLDTLEDLMDSVNYIMDKYGFPRRTLEEIRTFVGNGLKNLLTKCVPTDMSETDFEEALSEFKEYYGKNCQIKTRPYDGVMECIEALKKKGYKMAIVSNKADPAVKELNKIYFKGLIDVAIGERPGVARKPAPDSVYQALEELGISMKDREKKALYIGDSEVDRATAENAGLDCMSVEWGFRERKLLESLKPKYLISHPMDVVKILDDLMIEEIVNRLDGFADSDVSRMKVTVSSDVAMGEVKKAYHMGRCDIGSPWAKGKAFDVLDDGYK